MLEKIIKRLSTLGYKNNEIDLNIAGLNSMDEYQISFIEEKVINDLKSKCNITKLPKELENIVIDKICGEFLLAKKNLGQLKLNDLDLETAIKSTKEGDTEITFADKQSDSEKLDTLINHLINIKIPLMNFRKMRW